MDYVRTLILRIEAAEGDQYFETTPDDMAAMLGHEPSGVSPEEAAKLEYHLQLIEESGMAEFTQTGEGWIAERLTWKGHDFADSVRDDEIWRQAKDGVSAAKGFSVDLLAALAKGFIKKQIEQKTGIPIEF